MNDDDILRLDRRHPRLNRALTAQSERMPLVMFGGLTRESDSSG